MDGDTVVVGAHHSYDNGSRTGSVYVYEVSDSAIPNSAAGGTNATSYTVTGLTNETKYRFRIRATNSVGTGPTSDTKTVAPFAPPAKPTGLEATAGDTQATLTWDDPSDSRITGYEYFQQAQVAKLTASDGAANDYFGHSVAVDGDTAVVGAYQDNTAKGAAYVLSRQSGAWNQVAKLTASDAANYDYFGYSVAVDGDTVVVGSYADRGSKGSAYVFTKPGGGWIDATETAKLSASDGGTGDNFGISVGVDGDTVVVGAHADNSRKGAAYVFAAPTSGGWTNATQTAKLTASDGAANDHFGFSVAVDGDTVVAGAYVDDDNGPVSGSAYVFEEPSGGWVTATETVKLIAYDGTAEDWFGYSVAVDGDTVLVGAYQDDDKGSKSGSAYAYEVSDWSNYAVHDWTAIPNSAAGGTNDTSYTVTGLINDEKYYFSIRARNAVGAGPSSDAAIVTPTS